MNREDSIPLVVKSLKNPRSAVCKTALMTAADIFNAYTDHIIGFLDPLVIFLQWSSGPLIYVLIDLASHVNYVLFFIILFSNFVDAASTTSS